MLGRTKPLLVSRGELIAELLCEEVNSKSMLLTGFPTHPPTSFNMHAINIFQSDLKCFLSKTWRIFYVSWPVCLSRLLPGPPCLVCFLPTTPFSASSWWWHWLTHTHTPPGLRESGMHPRSEYKGAFDFQKHPEKWCPTSPLLIITNLPDRYRTSGHWRP